MRKPRRLCPFPDVRHTTPLGNFKVYNHDEDNGFRDNYNCVTVCFVSRMELHSDFQRDFWISSRTNRLLRVTNELQGKPRWVPVPYSLTLDTLAYSDDHLKKEIMQDYWDALQNTRLLWPESESRRKLLQMKNNLATKHKSITKIVCLGLGAMNLNKAFYASSLQHMAVFTIAEQLEKASQNEHPARSPVQVILQDPCYAQKDLALLGRLHRKGTLSCVSDPDGLLAIDSNTIVMTAFLPVGYPLMQIIADILHGANEKWPAAIVCDSMKLDPTHHLYRLTDRSSPQVARFLTEQYIVQDFEDHVLESELAEDVLGDQKRHY